MPVVRRRRRRRRRAGQHLECRAGTRLALQRDAAAHSPDDALGDAQAEACAAIAPGNVFVGLFELRKIRCWASGAMPMRYRAQEADFIGEIPGSTSAPRRRSSELDRIAGEVEQHLPQPCGRRRPPPSAAARRHRLRSRASGLRRGASSSVISSINAPARTAMFEIDLAGLDLE